MEDTIKVIVANEKHLAYVETILDTIEKAAKVSYFHAKGGNEGKQNLCGQVTIYSFSNRSRFNLTLFLLDTE